uniref:Aminoglycoside phosphotransferase domain-containing protein n=1 Tax=Mycena chlorophos TaxID=658473 RepID=A0ABQ0LC68_MYCCL|nr:predicted protein [Mycena chlorophos]
MYLSWRDPGGNLRGSPVGNHESSSSYPHPRPKITEKHIETLERIPDRLEKLELVHGDLRFPNLVFLPNDEQYWPLDLNPEARWAKGVVAGAQITPKHEREQISLVVKAWRHRLAENKPMDLDVVARLSGDDLYGPRSGANIEKFYEMDSLNDYERFESAYRDDLA